MIEVKGLTKKYGNLIAVNNASFEAQNGKITVLLGPNGAGKSTTIKSICSLLKYEGEILIDGYDNHSLMAKKRFGYIAEVPNLYDNLTVGEHISFIKRAYDVKEDEHIEKLIELLELKDKINATAKELSKGMKQKVSMLLALISKPDSLLVDEPMIGLDPKAIENTLTLLKELRDSGTAILLSTHIIDMMNDLYDVAYIMNKGKIEAKVVKDELGSETLKERFFEITEGSENE